MEKTGSVLLTQEELDQIKAGILPDRIEKDWGLTTAELIAIIESGNYQVVD